MWTNQPYDKKKQQFNRFNGCTSALISDVIVHISSRHNPECSCRRKSDLGEMNLHLNVRWEEWFFYWSCKLTLTPWAQIQGEEEEELPPCSTMQLCIEMLMNSFVPIKDLYVRPLRKKTAFLSHDVNKMCSKMSAFLQCILIHPMRVEIILEKCCF